MIHNGVIKPVELIANDQTVSGQHPLPVAQGLSLPAHDYVGLSYTGSDLTTVVFKTGGAAGTTVATLTLTYSGGLLATVTKS